MELPDTSVWIDHFRKSDPVLRRLSARDEIVIHPYVIGELAMGQLRPRAKVLAELLSLRQTEIASQEEVLDFVQQQALFGIGVGYVDAHLLITASRTKDLVLWTRDKRLKLAAVRLGVASLHV